MKQKCSNCFYWTKATFPEPKPGERDDLRGSDAPRRRKIHYCKLSARICLNDQDTGTIASKCPEFKWCWDAKRLRYPAQDCVFCANLGGHMVVEDGGESKPEFYCIVGEGHSHEACKGYEPATKKHRRTEVG